MRVDKLELVNFRGFERRAFDFNSRMNVLIGRNGTGKTAVLDALAIAVRPFVGVFDAAARDHVDLNIMRVVPYIKGGDLTLERCEPVEINTSGTLGAAAWGSKRSFSVFPPERPPAFVDSEKAGTALGQGATSLVEAVRRGEDTILPLVAYFGTDRLWRPALSDESIDPLGPGSRLRGYSDCLRIGSSFRQLRAWFKRMELIKLQDGAALPMHEAAKDAIKSCLEGWDEVTFSVRLDDLVARTADGRRLLPFHNLSDGVRNMIGMAGEIAYRAALLNPHLGAEAAQKTPGIVLIDEVDLHLHPSWQRRVIDDLRRAFPEIQFFATTHSPNIVQSLRPGELVDLDDGEAGEYQNRSVEDILENVMGVAGVQRSERWQAMHRAAEEYYRALQSARGASTEDVARLKAKLDELSEPFGDNPAYMAFLKMEREAAGLGRSTS